MISAKDRAQAAALSQQAYLTFQSGDYDQALTLLSQSDQLKPDQPDGWNLRGVILLKKKAFDKAQAAFARAAALDPALWAAQFNLAEVLFQRKEYDRARAGFERLLSQTDRFKEKNRWELVQYKAFVCCLLMGADQDAAKKLAKLPEKDGATPAFFYAQAALSFSRKNAVQAQKTLLAAQTAFPVAMNDLFTDSLVQAGWQSPLPPMAALTSNVPAYPPGTTLPQTVDSSGRSTFEIDPRLQAASAGPLPVSDAPTQPVVSPITPALRNAPPLTADAKPKVHPASSRTAEALSALNPAADTGLENGGLLLLDE